MNDNEKYIEEFVKDIPFDAPDSGHRDELKKQLLSAFPKHRFQPSVQTTSVRRIILNKQLIRLTAAAIIVIAAIIGLNIMSNTGGVAWGDLIERIEKVQTVVYQMRMKMKGVTGIPEGKTAEIKMEAKQIYDRGFYINSVTKLDDDESKTRTWVLFDQNTIVSVIPENKKYIKMKLTGELLEKMKEENGDPKELLKRTMKYEYEKLGRDTINGIEVEGIEVKDPTMGVGMFDEFVTRLWCDVKSDLPVLMIMKGSTNNGEMVLDITIDDFNWDVEIDPAELVPDIPADYELLAETEVGGGIGKEKDLIEQLRFFAETADGRYPSSLTGMTVVTEFVKAIRIKLAGQEPNDVQTKELMGNVVSYQMIGMTYATMVKDGNEPAYYGDKVTAEFPQAVLLRWKTGEDRYRVIFGDLSIRDVDSNELTKLEAAPLNPSSKAIKPQPADGLVGTKIENLELSWMPGANSAGHKVYLGTNSNALTLLADVNDLTSTVATTLERGVTYFWRVDEIQSDGSIVTSDLWSFNTGGLVGWWRLNEGSGGTATDSGGNNLNGKIAGNPVWIDGVEGHALQLDGDGDYVDLGNDSSLNITHQITVAAWIKVDTFDVEWQAVINKGDGSWRLQRNGTKDSIEFACTGAFVPGALVGSLFGTVNVNDGQWHHIAGTYDGSRVYLYVDGKLDVSSEATGSIRINDYNVLIGANAEKPDREFKGSIDDIRIYNYALNAEEIKEISAGQSFISTE
jgi:hypothetical protein